MTPYYDHAGVTIYHGDAREILPTLVHPADVGVASVKERHALSLAQGGLFEEAPKRVRAKEAWCTPEDFLVKVRHVGPLGFDPCWNEEAITRPRIGILFHGPGEAHRIRERVLSDGHGVYFGDGLEKNWIEQLTPGEVAFINPPFGAALKPWSRKIAQQGAAAIGRGGVGVVALVPAATDTNWFRDNIERTGTLINFLSGRLTFLGATDPATFSCVAALWGPPDFAARFREAFRGSGWFHVGPQLAARSDVQLSGIGTVYARADRR